VDEKIVITWTGADGQLIAREFDAEVAIERVLRGLAVFTNPDAETAAALEQPRDQAAHKLADEARAHNDRILSGFFGTQDDLDWAQALCFRMKGVD
jgi:hypothetical protein